MSGFVKWCWVLWSVITAIAVLSVSGADPQLEDEELRAIDFLRYMNGEMRELTKKSLLAAFTYDTNATKINRKAMINATMDVSKRRKELLKEIGNFNWHTYKDPHVKRQFLLSSKLGTQALSDAKYKKWLKLTSDMKEVTNCICPVGDTKKCDKPLQPDMAKYNQSDLQLQETYLEYVRSIGHKVKPMFKEYVELMNEAAKLNGFKDAGEEWVVQCEDTEYKKHSLALYKAMKPLYTLLHGYVRYKLRGKYGEVVSKNGPIPLHLTGSLYGDSFRELYHLVKPYPGVVQVDYDLDVVLKNYTTEKIFKTAEAFYVSMNMTPMPDSFWNHSVFTNTTDCVAMTYDIAPNDPRLKVCNQQTMDGLKLAHEQLGPIEYYLQFGDLPQVFRNAPSEGFYEAVGGAVGISFRSLNHLKQIDFWATRLTDEVYLNNAFYIALKSLPALAFAYAVETWRWETFAGNVTEGDYNCPWWKMVEELQGLEPPVDRSSDDFDVAAKYVVPYVGHFTRTYLEFQLYRALCSKAGVYEAGVAGRELYKCDLYGHSEAGNALKAVLSLGSSKPWPDALEALTGQRFIDSSAILEYFRPVQLWLENEIERLDIPVGWTKSMKVCHKNNTNVEKN